MKRSNLTWVMAHLAGWSFFFSLVIAFLYNSPGRDAIFSIFFSGSFLLFSVLFLFLFYFNTYVLIPEFYLRKKYAVYFIIIILFLLAIWFLKPFDNLMEHFGGTGNDLQSLPPDPLPGSGPQFPLPLPTGRNMRPPAAGGEVHTDIVSIILFLAVWSLSTAICIIRQWRITEKRAIQAEADKANAELSFLKAQINPHFLFNTLNNIYSLAVTRNELTAASILKLSNIMRYVTDDIRKDVVLLSHELARIADYIDLQRLRLGRKMNVDFSTEGEIGNQRIAPLILMTFIENAFKFGISNHEESVIRVRIVAGEHDIFFLCQNRCLPVQASPERTGIGISNARERLHYLYPGRHTLEINNEKGFFIVQLTLDISV